jgi:TonB family protein
LENSFLVETPGFCSRHGGCSIAASGKVVRVPLENAFVCPECGAPLRSPALGDIRPLARKPVFLASALGIVALLAASVVLAQSGFFHRGAPVPAPDEAAITVSLPATSLQRPAPVGVVDTLTAPTAVAVPIAEAATTLHAARGTGLRPPAGPILLRHAEVARRRHADVHLSYSIPLVSGGAPDYPEQYEDGRSGTVTVSCGLRPDGTPQGCATTSRTGGPIFDVAVHSWLDLKDVRFKPARIHGRLTNHVKLRVDFIGEPPSP